MLTIDDACWARLERRFGPHDVDRFASVTNARLARFNTAVPTPGSEGAPALTQAWEGCNNFAFPPLFELPALAQLLASRPALQATVVAPH